MTSTIIEMQTTLNEKRNSFINWIEFNINDKKVLDAAIKYFEFEESVRKATLKLAEIDYLASKSIDTDNKNLDAVISQFKIDSTFNLERSEKWLVEALKLVLIHKCTFDGLRFTNGNINKLKTHLL